ncbi:pyridoxamine 5'-phosphate oxidase family protein [Falsibacillus albus]|uniref:General stress protein n=1 Tax=Falsibacillus albus TaxID=2478915 RepID=A0A3L7JZJ0_9BACI|nr:pyridoxamine 5'-phosphate oxidase family protein [Falsibacillus albus]RLQ96193.1 general stress protein [Falsibacillus albus]
MNQQELKEKVLSVLKENKVGTLATVKNNKPHTRYMTFFNDELTLFTATSRETHKTDEIAENPNVHILIGYDGNGYGDTYLEIEGIADIKDDDATKQKLWNDHLEPWFNGPDDPNYIVLQIKPNNIVLMNDQKEGPQALKL